MSDWKIDENGKRYRMVGNTREYAPIINTTHGTFYQDDFEETMKQVREHRETAERDAFNKERANHTAHTCPFKRSSNSYHADCLKDCPFYENGCLFAKTDRVPEQDTITKRCPIAQDTCFRSCAMYNNGCMLVEKLKA